MAMPMALPLASPSAGQIAFARPRLTRCPPAKRRCVCRAGGLADLDGIEAVEGVRPEIDAAIAAALDRCVVDTDLGMGVKHTGKVRDTYDLGDKLVIVTTDRQSAFDRLLAAVPFKGAVLNQTSAWWMARAAAAGVARHALLATPDPAACVMRRCDVFPVEFVARGFLTGSTETSLWTHYAAGARDYCGLRLPDGLAKNARLAAPVLTPTTKAADRDVPIAPADIVGRGLMSAEHWEAASAAALRLFAFGQAEAARRGLLLVDTKYEFGVDPGTGEVLLVDEVHTPDSSRYWLAGSYAARHAAGLEPQNVDKEFLRLWFRARCDPYGDAPLPAAPAPLVAELSRRYVLLYETITGERFEPPPADEDPGERIRRNVARALEELA